MTPAEVLMDSEAVDANQQDEEDGLDRYSYPSQQWHDTEACADESGAVTEYGPEHAGQSATEEAEALASDEGAEIDYWEEVTLEDGSVCFYNHTSQEYVSELPTNEAITPIDEEPACPPTDDELQPAGTADPNNQSQLGVWEGQVWEGSDGEVFVPWPEDVSQAMKSSPEAGGTSDEQLATPEEEEEPFTPDDPDTVREQNLRALLVLLPAKIMKGVVAAAMAGAMRHTQRTATAEGERRRRSLLSRKAEFRYALNKGPKVATPGQLVTTGNMELQDGGSMSDGMEMPSTADGEATQSANTVDSWRNSTTQERDTIVGDKLEEVLRVLYSTSKEEARLTMRAIYLSSQAIGAAGAYQLAPALKSCVIVALHLGNNAIGDKGITALADGLRHARGLQKLHLNDNEISDVGCHRLANALGPLKVLSALDLCHNPFGDKACLSLATYLSQPGCPLRSLSVAGCLDVDPAAWKTINVRGREGVAWDPPRPGDDGAVSLAAALMCPHGCPLRRLRMANAGMKTTGAKAIAAALCANHTLESIDLSGNNFGCKADDEAWESASELLSFGLQVNRTVHTIVLRACALSREQVLAIQGNTVPQTTGARGIHPKGREEGNPSAVLGGAGAGEGGDGVGTKSDPLPWREEKRLGFRAACLRDWLLDAARVKGMRYPRPQSPDPDDTVSFNTKTSAGGHSRNEAFPPVRPEYSNQSEDQDHMVVERRLQTGLTTLQRVLALFEAGKPLPRGLGGIDDILGSTCRGNREESLPSQGLETGRDDKVEGDSNAQGSSHRGREMPSTSGGTDAWTVMADTARSNIDGNSEDEGGGVSETTTNSTSQSSVPASSRPRESSGSSGSTTGSTPRSSSNEGNRSAEVSSNSDRSEHGGAPRSLSTQWSGSTGASSEADSDTRRHGGVASSLPRQLSGSTGALTEMEENSSISSRPEAFGLVTDGNKDAGSSPATTIPDKDCETICNGDIRGHFHISPVQRGRVGSLVRAADLEVGAQEGLRLASLAGTACDDMDEKEVALLREGRILRQERDALRHRTLEEATMLDKSLVDAGAARDVACDSVRRLGPIATAARISERAGKGELEEWRLASGRRAHGPQDGGADLVSMEQLENDWGERSQHAQAMAEELQEAQRHQEVAERKTEELKLGERSLQLRMIEYDNTFHEKSAEITALLAGVRTRRAALMRTKNLLKALAVKFDKLAEGAREEEALRVLVPAGSKRRDLDLQVAEAVRLTSEVAREVEETRLRRDTAAVRLERARWDLAAARSSDKDDQGLEASAAVSMTRPTTAPTLSSTKPSPFVTKKEGSPLVGDSLPADDRRREDGKHQRVGTRSSDVGGSGVTDEEDIAQAMAGAGTTETATIDGRSGGLEEAAGSTSTETAAEAENVGRLSEDYANADRKFRDAVARGESAPIKRALALIRDHGDILRLNEKDTPEDPNNSALVQGRPGKKRRPRAETPLLGVQLNAQMALGAKIALLRGSGEEDEEGNPVLPEIDDRFLTVGQRLRRLRDAREGAQREKHRAYLDYSRQVKRNLRARKRFALAEKRAGRIAETMDTKQLVEALKERGYSTEGSEQLDQLRRVFVEGIRPDMRIRLHATSRWTKSRNKHRERANNTVEIGEIAARRQRLLLPPFAQRVVGHDIRHAVTA